MANHKGFGQKPDRPARSVAYKNDLVVVYKFPKKVNRSAIQGLQVYFDPDDKGLYQAFLHTEKKRHLIAESSDLNYLQSGLAHWIAEIGIPSKLTPERELGFIRRTNEDGGRVGMPERGESL
jgi:hypothetical protein